MGHAKWALVYGSCGVLVAFAAIKWQAPKQTPQDSKQAAQASTQDAHQLPPIGRYQLFSSQVTTRLPDARVVEIALFRIDTATGKTWRHELAYFKSNRERDGDVDFEHWVEVDFYKNRAEAKALADSKAQAAKK